MNANYPSRIQRGFTLIELVIVLAVLGALAAVAVPQLTGLQEEADLAGTATTVSSELGNAFARQLADDTVDQFVGSASNICGSSGGQLDSVSAALSSGGYQLVSGSTEGVEVSVPSYNSSNETISSVSCYLQAN